MKRPRSRRLWSLLAVLVALFLVGRWLDRSQPIQSYRVIDDRTIAIEVNTSVPQWTRVTDVVETSDRVIVSAGSFIFPWPQGAGAATSGELFVTLRQPLGGRIVIDGTTGLEVERSPCPWSLWHLGKCDGQTGPP
jgi:hypothetical protein